MRPDAYAAIARWYDLATGVVLRSVRERLAARIAESGAARVIDLGCGTGVLAAMLMERGMEVACVDASPAMLAEAVKRVPEARLLPAEEIPLPFEDAAFDACILSLVLHESVAPEALLREALRLAPRCFVIEWRMPERNLDLLARPLVHCIERLAGKEHYAGFLRFARIGYLHGIAGNTGARVEREETVKAGTLVIAEVSK